MIRMISTEGQAIELSTEAINAFQSIVVPRSVVIAAWMSGKRIAKSHQRY
jgi:hypothetical protein